MGVRVSRRVRDLLPWEPGAGEGRQVGEGEAARVLRVFGEVGTFFTVPSFPLPLAPRQQLKGVWQAGPRLAQIIERIRGFRTSTRKINRPCKYIKW